MRFGICYHNAAGSLLSAELITEAKSSIKLEKTVVQHTPDD